MDTSKMSDILQETDCSKRESISEPEAMVVGKDIAKDIDTMKELSREPNPSGSGAQGAAAITATTSASSTERRIIANQAPQQRHNDEVSTIIATEPINGLAKNQKCTIMTPTSQTKSPKNHHEKNVANEPDGANINVEPLATTPKLIQLYQNPCDSGSTGKKLEPPQSNNANKSLESTVGIPFGAIATINSKQVNQGLLVKGGTTGTIIQNTDNQITQYPSKKTEKEFKPTQIDKSNTSLQEPVSVASEGTNDKHQKTTQQLSGTTNPNPLSSTTDIAIQPIENKIATTGSKHSKEELKHIKDSNNDKSTEGSVGVKSMTTDKSDPQEIFSKTNISCSDHSNDFPLNVPKDNPMPIDTLSIDQSQETITNNTNEHQKNAPKNGTKEDKDTKTQNSSRASKSIDSSEGMLSRRRSTRAVQKRELFSPQSGVPSKNSRPKVKREDTSSDEEDNESESEDEDVDDSDSDEEDHNEEEEEEEVKEKRAPKTWPPCVLNDKSIGKRDDVKGNWLYCALCERKYKTQNFNASHWKDHIKTREHRSNKAKSGSTNVKRENKSKGDDVLPVKNKTANKMKTPKRRRRAIRGRWSEDILNDENILSRDDKNGTYLECALCLDHTQRKYVKLKTVNFRSKAWIAHIKGVRHCEEVKMKDDPESDQKQRWQPYVLNDKTVEKRDDRNGIFVRCRLCQINIKCCQFNGYNWKNHANSDHHLQLVSEENGNNLEEYKTMMQTKHRIKQDDGNDTTEIEMVSSDHDDNSDTDRSNTSKSVQDDSSIEEETSSKRNKRVLTVTQTYPHPRRHKKMKNEKMSSSHASSATNSNLRREDTSSDNEVESWRKVSDASFGISSTFGEGETGRDQDQGLSQDQDHDGRHKAQWTIQENKVDIEVRKMKLTEEIERSKIKIEEQKAKVESAQGHFMYVKKLYEDALDKSIDDGLPKRVRKVAKKEMKLYKKEKKEAFKKLKEARKL